MEQGTDQEQKQKHRVALMRKSSEMDKLFISHISQKKKEAYHGSVDTAKHNRQKC